MTTRPSVSRRIAAAVLGVERPARGPEDIAARRGLPFGRRLLAAVLGVRVRAEARQVSALTDSRARTEAARPAEAQARTTGTGAAEARAGGTTEAAAETHAGATSVSLRHFGRDTAEGHARTAAANPAQPSAPGGRVGAAVESETTPAAPAFAHRDIDLSVHVSARVDRQEAIEPGEPPETPPRWSYEGRHIVPQHLLSEDRPEYERLLDEALRSAPHRPELSAVGQRLSPEQLRTMALNATSLITATAATEYQHYVRVREAVRSPAPSTPSWAGEPDSAESGTGARGLTASMGEVAETAGAGVIAVVAVLFPVLTGTAAAIFLLVGYLLKMFDPEPAFAQTMLTTGWVFGAVMAASVLVGVVGLLLTALRNRPTLATGPYDEPGGEVARAREAWREALLERGIVPFLREALADPGTTSALHRTTPSASPGRGPHLGYSRPGFVSPSVGPAASPRPAFTSPDYTSPDFGGPEHGGPGVPSPDPAAQDSESD